MPASRSAPTAAATTTSGDTSSAAPSPGCGGWKSRDARRSRGQPRSWRPLPHPPARDIEKHFLQRGPVVARHDLVGAVVILDAAALHDDDAVAQPLYFQHVVRCQQDGGVMGLAVILQML